MGLNLNNNLADYYSIESSFTKIDSQALTKINQNRTRMGKEFILSRNEIFMRFLEKITSREEQLKVFDKGNYSEKFGYSTMTLSAKNAAVSQLLKSIEVFEPKIKKGALLSSSFVLKMTGENSEILELFLDDLIASVSYITSNEFQTDFSEIITISLKNITFEQDVIVIKINKDFLAESYKKEQRLKQKIIRLKNDISLLRRTSEKEKLNLIVKITEQINMAKSLDVYDNNLNKYRVTEPNSSVSLSFGNMSDLPQWFLYGQKALENQLQMIELRETNDSFIPNLSNITIELNESISLLAEMRKSKSSESDWLNESKFSANYIKLDMEKIFLENIQSMKIKEINPIVVTQFANSTFFSSQKNILIPLILAFFFGLLLSAFSLTIIDSYKNFKNN